MNAEEFRQQYYLDHETEVVTNDYYNRIMEAYAAAKAAEIQAELNHHTKQQILVWDYLQKVSPWSPSNDMEWADEVICGIDQLLGKIEESERPAAGSWKWLTQQYQKLTQYLLEDIADKQLIIKNYKNEVAYLRSTLSYLLRAARDPVANAMQSDASIEGYPV